MDENLERIFAKLRSTADFADTDFSDINACSIDGDTALHCVARWGDIAAAQALIGAGIDVSRAGDLGCTPLHVACMKGDLDMIRLLIENGADPFAMSEGETPFSAARLAGHSQACDLLQPLMATLQSQDPKVWIRGRIGQLTREIERLKRQL